MVQRCDARKVGQKNAYICPSCDRTKGYYTKNETKVHKATKNHKTYGFELECIPRSPQKKRVLINSKYQFIPTKDGSLPPTGIEFKTPIYNSMRGLRKLFKMVIKNVNFTSPKCGQHINIGDTSYINIHTMDFLRSCGNIIFDRLGNYMKLHTDDTIRVCGRYFTNYANMYSTYNTHKSWINLTHDDRIEFRISKFVTPNQYFNLTCMWTEMIDLIINNLLKKPFTDYRTSDKALEKVQSKLIEIFKKYANHSALCQQRVA